MDNSLIEIDYVFFIFIVILFTSAIFIFEYRRIKRINDNLYSFLYKTEELSVNDFFYLRTQKRGKSYISNDYNIPGVYILRNKTQGMYYIGQGKKVLSRANHHLTGKGNGDVYADYKYGDTFTVQIVPLDSTNYKYLNDLEREYIRFFDAYKQGYNKTRGNK